MAQPASRFVMGPAPSRGQGSGGPGAVQPRGSPQPLAMKVMRKAQAAPRLAPPLPSHPPGTEVADLRVSPPLSWQSRGAGPRWWRTAWPTTSTGSWRCCSACGTPPWWPAGPPLSLCLPQCRHFPPVRDSLWYSAHCTVSMAPPSPVSTALPLIWCVEDKEGMLVHVHVYSCKTLCKYACAHAHVCMYTYAHTCVCVCVL